MSLETESKPRGYCRLRSRMIFSNIFGCRGSAKVCRRDELIDEDSQGPPVDARIVPLGEDELRAEVLWRSAQGEAHVLQHLSL